MGYINRHKVFFAVQRQVYPANFQEKTITPNTFQREITPDVGYDALSKVKLNGILVDAHTEIESQVDSDVKYIKTVPTGALQYAGLNKVGGMSYKFNQIANDTVISSSYSENGITFTFANHIMTINGTATATAFSQYIVLNLKQGHKYLKTNITQPTTNTFAQIYDVTNGNNYSENIFEVLNDTTQGLFRMRIESGQTMENVKFVFNCFDLTDMYGLGNEPTTVDEFKARFNKDYYDYTVAALHHSLVTSIESNEDYEIPSEVQALSGYGMGVDNNCYNYIDFESKKFIQKVGFAKMKDLDWQYNTVNNFFFANDVGDLPLITLIFLCNAYNFGGYATDGEMASKPIGLYVSNSNSAKGVKVKDTAYSTVEAFVNHFTDNDYILFELATPVETDISDYITQDTLDVINTITFENEYEQAVPSEINYLIEV